MDLLSRTLLCARERDQLLIRRPWTRRERRVVFNGLVGRMAIAIEPVICGAVFLGLFIGMMMRDHDAKLLAPIFGLATLAFVVYAVVLMVPPIRAFVQTFAPIYIVDGYVRYRSPDHGSEIGENGYIAVLNDERREIAEWPSRGDDRLPHATRAAMIEFSHFGGIHRIDGRSTGVLPEAFAPLGVGVP